MPNFTRVQDGDPLSIPPEAWNSMLDVIDPAQGRKGGAGQTSARQDYGRIVIHIKNSSGADRAAYDVLGIAGPLITPTDNLAEFMFSAPALVGVTPDTADHLGRLAILLGPLKSGDIGEAIICGLTVAHLNTLDSGHLFAEIKDGDPTTMESASTGSARIIWKETSTGSGWALLMLAGGTGDTDSTTDKLVAVSDNDTTPGYLNGKLVGHSGDTDYIRITLAEQNDGADESLQIKILKSDIQLIGGIEATLLHRHYVPKGAAAGTYTISTDDWRGRVLLCWLKVIYSDWPSYSGGWGGGSEAGISRYLGSNWSQDPDRALQSASGGDVKLMINGSGHIYWKWILNDTGYHLHMIGMVQATGLL